MYGAPALAVSAAIRWSAISTHPAGRPLTVPNAAHRARTESRRTRKEHSSYASATAKALVELKLKAWTDAYCKANHPASDQLEGTAYGVYEKHCMREV